nr:EOG090X0AVC [Ceriodaphnia reticulata]
MSDRESDDIFGEIEKNRFSSDEDVLSSQRHGKVDASTGTETSEKPLGPTKTRKLVRGAQLKLDPNRIGGPRGITAVAKSFQDVKLKGKEHVKSDLDIILAKMEHWAHRLFPKLPFDDCVEQIAKLGNNRLVQVHLKRFRMEMTRTELETEDDINTNEFFNEIKKPDENDVFEAIMTNSSNVIAPAITEDQQNRMAENKQRAEEKRKSRMLCNSHKS